MIGISTWFCKILLRNPLCKTGCHGTREKNIPVTVNKQLKKKKKSLEKLVVFTIMERSMGINVIEHIAK